MRAYYGMGWALQNNGGIFDKRLTEGGEVAGAQDTSHLTVTWGTSAGWVPRFALSLPMYTQHQQVGSSAAAVEVGSSSKFAGYARGDWAGTERLLHSAAQFGLLVLRSADRALRISLAAGAPAAAPTHGCGAPVDGRLACTHNALNADCGARRANAPRVGPEPPEQARPCCLSM